MYENLAAKYRPGNLEEVLGQETVKQTLQNAVKLGRVAHSYVFHGPRGCGKTTIARILAKTLNCHKPSRDGHPCGKCASCLEIPESKSLDVIEIDAASNTGVDDVRSVIVNQADFSPSRDKNKIYILDEVHMLSKGAFNALLKTVEEPPAHVVFIMATTEQEKVPATILSRSQCFRFRPITEADMASRLAEVAAAEKIKAEPEALRLIARSAGGAMRDALTMLDRAASFGQGEVKVSLINELLGHPDGEIVNALALALVNRDAAGLHSAFDKINAEGSDPLAALRELRNAFGEAFLAAQGFSKAEPIKGLPKDLPAGALARLSRKVNALVEEVKYSDSLSLAAEIGLFTLIETPQDLEALVRRLEAMEARGGAAGPAPAYSQPAAPAPQKKNDLAAPAPAAPPPEAPAASPGRGGPEAWKKLLGQVSARKPALFNALLSVRLVYESEARWRLQAASKFEAGMIETSRALLEELLEQNAGRRIALVPETAQAAPASAPQDYPDAPPQDGETALVEPDEAEAAREAPAAPPKPHAPRQVAPESEPELKHLNKVFQGRISRVNKVK